MNARNNLSYTEVKSPSNGVIGTLPYRVGALVSASLPKPLTTVSDNSEMYVYFSMTENQLLALTRQYGSKDKALENMPEIELQLNDKSLYPQTGKDRDDQRRYRSKHRNGQLCVPHSRTRSNH